MRYLQFPILRSRTLVTARLHTQEDPELGLLLPEGSHVEDASHLHEEDTCRVEVGRRMEAVLEDQIFTSINKSRKENSKKNKTLKISAINTITLI